MFLESLKIELDKPIDLFSVQLEGDGFIAEFNCVFDRSDRRLFLQLVPAKLPTDRSVQRACCLLANNLVDFGEELGATSVHLCIKKGDKQYATWMRSSLYVGFALLSGSKTRKLLACASTVILRLKLDFVKDDVSDCTASTCDSESQLSPIQSPSSICSETRDVGRFLLDA